MWYLYADQTKTLLEKSSTKQIVIYNKYPWVKLLVLKETT